MIYFKWNKPDNGIGRIMADYGYDGQREQIGILTKNSSGLFAILENLPVIEAQTATALKALVIEKKNAHDNEMVPVVNLISGTHKTVWIRRCEKGGPCDPSTELYHCS